MCKQWHEQTPGNCTYGEKCQFIHDEDLNEIHSIKAAAEEKHNNMIKQQIEKQMLARPINDDFSSSGKGKHYVQKNRMSNGGFSNNQRGASEDMTVSEFDSNHCQLNLSNPFPPIGFNVDEFAAPTINVEPLNQLQLTQSQSESTSKFTDEKDEVSDNVGDILGCMNMDEQSTFRDIKIDSMLQGGIEKQNSLEQLVRGTHFNKGLLGDFNDNLKDDQGVFNIFNANTETIFSPQLVRFESRTFEQIEENIQKEILDYSSCDDTAVQVDPSLSDNCAVNVDGTDSLQQSTMTNSESPSPKKDENNHEYSFSAASDDEAEFDNVEVNAALNDLKGPKRTET